jgi:hypothetical protein
LHEQFVPGSQTYAAAEADEWCGDAHGLRCFPIGGPRERGVIRRVEPIEPLDRESLRQAGTRLAMNHSRSRTHRFRGWPLSQERATSNGAVDGNRGIVIVRKTDPCGRCEKSDS